MPGLPATRLDAGRARRRMPRVTPPGRLRADRAARWVVTAGGLSIIACILAILVFIVAQVLPLLAGATVRPEATLALDRPDRSAVLTDEHRTHLAVASSDGRIRVARLPLGELVFDRPALDPAEDGETVESVSSVPGDGLLVAATSRGRLVAWPMAWDVTFSGDRRVVAPSPGAPVPFALDPERRPLDVFAARVAADGAALAAGLTRDGELLILRRQVEVNPITEDAVTTWHPGRLDCPAPVSHLLLDAAQRNLYGTTRSGDLLHWTIPGDGTPRVARSASGPVGAVALLLGDRSLVVGRESGAIEIWSNAPTPEGGDQLLQIRGFPSFPAPVRLLAAAPRGKSFLAQDAAGELALFHSTSQRTLFRGASPDPAAESLTWAPKGDAALVAGPGGVHALAVDNPHPEVSLTSLFGRVWYEGHSAPEYVWQSSGGTDDFEPKLSLVPLMFGTLKGTVYSLLLAVPLGVFGAMYASQFMHPGLRRYVKPTVEIMAALPSVVLGFVAGLWLAPRVERVLGALFLAALVMPAAVVAAGALWDRLPARVRGRVRPGAETLIYAAVILAVGAACVAVAPTIERLVLGDGVGPWLQARLGLTYDQRNAVVVGLAMGFAVIPIVFSIAEDAFANVPQSLVSASLALGANRWQTVSRVVLPTASAGIFSAVMIGFGRAVGETMIVLMATGNTPILDWSPFDGFRTLSANIAVEIPEAPHGGTLYRTLFLAALILFAFTFAANTVAELVRQRLRQRYSQL